MAPALFGGSAGTIVGNVVGVLIPVVLTDGLIILGVQRFWLFVAIGAVPVAPAAVPGLRGGRAGCARVAPIAGLARLIHKRG